MIKRFLLVLGLGSAVSLGAFGQTPSPEPTTSGSSSPAPASSPKSTASPVQEGYSDQKPATHLGYSSVYVDGPYVALTFDDGPQGTFTPHLLDILKEKNVKATFFMVGQCVEEFPDVVRRVAAEGHEIGNHSFSHPAFGKMSDAAVRSELMRTTNAIEAAAGLQPKVMRPPYGSITNHEREWITNELGMKVILWSVDPLDWRDRNSATVERRIVAGAQPGAIVLSHDIHKTTVDAMAETIDQLKARGFKFVTVSELIAMEKPRPSATPTPQTSGTETAKPAPTVSHPKKKRSH